MPVTITAPSSNQMLTRSARNVDELVRAIDLTLGLSHYAILGVQVAAETMGGIWDAVEGIACRMDDPDRIEAIRFDEDACRAELDVATGPVDPRRLH